MSYFMDRLIDLFYPHGHNGQMKSLLISVIFGLILSGCASYRTKPVVSPPAVTKKEGKTPEDNKIRPGTPALQGGYYAVWDLLNGEQVTLQLKNVDNGKNLTVIIQNGLSQTKIGSGHWELTGFEENGKSYLSMNISKKFVFVRKPKTNVYAGSIVIGCPKIASTDFKLLREMKYFNRYPFSSSTGLCELVIGNDFARVRSSIKKSQKSSKLNLENGL